jgi:hypothetical protein
MQRRRSAAPLFSVLLCLGPVVDVRVQQSATEGWVFGFELGGASPSATCRATDPADLFEVYVGVPTEEVFSGSPTVVQVPMPDHGDYVWLADLNKDGKQDIVLHHPSCCRGDMHREATTEPSGVTLLMAG